MRNSISRHDNVTSTVKEVELEEVFVLMCQHGCKMEVNTSKVSCVSSQPK